MYRPTTSRTLAMNSGSADSFHVSTRCGLRPKARQIRDTDDCDSPVSAAIDRVDQCVSWPGPFSVRTRVTATSTCSSVIFRGAPGRGASARPFSRPPANRTRHLRTDLPRYIQPGRDRRQRCRPVLLRAGQHDPRPQRQRLRRRPLADQRLQRLALSIGQQQRDKLRARHAPSLQPATIFLTQDTSLVMNWTPGELRNHLVPRVD